MLTSFSKHLEFHPLFYVFARFLQVGTAAFRMLWHLSSSTQSYGILITSLDTDCPSTGWPVGEKAKILPKNLLVERIWHCHGMTRLRASNTKLWFHFVQYWAIRLYFICMPCFVCIICWNGPPWFLPLGIVDPKNLKNDLQAPNFELLVAGNTWKFWASSLHMFFLQIQLKHKRNMKCYKLLMMWNGKK